MQGSDPNGGQFANSRGAVNWQRHEEVVSTQGGDSATWNQGISRSHPMHNRVFENFNNFSNSLQLNQDEFPTLGAAADSKFHSTTVRKEDKHNGGQDQRTGNSTSYLQTHRDGWYEDERQMQRDHNGNELVSGISNLHHPSAVHHGTYYAPMQMYPSAHGRPMVQHQGYYAHVPYSDGSYHPPHGHFYPPMYATYHQGYLPAEPYDQRSGTMQFNPRRKMEDNQQNSSPMRWTGERPPARLIKRQSRGDDQQQDQDNGPQEEALARAESLTTDFLQRRKEESQELDWDAQVDAEEKRKDEKTQEVTNAVLDEIKQESVTQMPEWNYAKFRASLEAEEYVPSPALSNRRFVNPIPPKERRNYSDDVRARGGGFLIRGRYRPRGDRAQEAETRSNADSSSENQASRPVRMFPGRGFRPKGPPPRSPKTPHSTIAPNSQQDFASEVGLQVTVPDHHQSTPIAASSELGTTFAESLTESEEGTFTFGVGRLIRPRAPFSTPRGRHSGGRFRGHQRFSEHRGRSPHFSENHSLKLSDRGGGRYRGRGVHTPRSEGSSYRGGSRGRGRGRGGFPRDNGRSYGRGRGRREPFTPRGQRGGHLPVSPKMQWVPKKPHSSDG